LIAGRARFRGARRIEKLCGYRLSDLAFSDTMLETLNTKINFDALDNTLRSQILEFFNEFLRCKCRNAPLCGCPERKFAKRIIELRENGLDHRQISAYLLDEYGIEIFPADVLSFLEDSVHVLEAIRDVAHLKGQQSLVEKTNGHIRLIER
jgi:superfamily II helicase